MPSFIILPTLITFVVAASPRVRPLVAHPQNITTSPRVHLDGRIVGGQTVKIEFLPYQLSVLIKKRHICGASILTAARALTAAHCTYERNVSQMFVRASSSSLESGGQYLKVAEARNHRNYKFKADDYDVSVLVLKDNISLGLGAEALSLVAKGIKLPDGTMAIVSGWGKYSNREDMSKNLRQATVYKVNDKTCKKAYRWGCFFTRIKSRMTCYGRFGVGGRGPCNGDSGGPLVMKKYDGIHVEIFQIGIISWGWECGSRKFPDVFTDIAHKSIHKHITDNLK